MVFFLFKRKLLEPRTDLMVWLGGKEHSADEAEVTEDDDWARAGRRREGVGKRDGRWGQGKGEDEGDRREAEENAQG